MKLPLTLPAAFKPRTGHPVHGHLVVQKIGTGTMVSTESIPMRIGRTRDEEYVWAVSLEWGRAQDAARQVQLAELWTTLELLADVGGSPLLRVVLELHQPRFVDYSDHQVTCTGCDFDGAEAEHPEWPCRTIQVLAAECGIEVPL